MEPDKTEQRWGLEQMLILMTKQCKSKQNKTKDIK
jgi:hypothetical protein